MLAGLRQADGGTAVVLGVDTQHDAGRVRPHLGVQLQESRLPARMTVGEATALYASFYPDPADVDDLLALLGLADQRRTTAENQALTAAWFTASFPAMQLVVLAVWAVVLYPLAARLFRWS